MRPNPLWLCLLLLSCVLGCGERDEYFDTPVAISSDSPVVLERHLVFVDQEGFRAFVLDVEAAQAGSRVVELAPNPTLAERRRGDSDEVLILSEGWRGDREQQPEPAELQRLLPDGTLHSYPLEAPFNALVQSEDGRFAFLYFASEADRLLVNANEIALIDLTMEPAGDDAEQDPAVHRRTLRSFGESPEAVFFSPPMDVLGEMRRLVVVFSQSYLTVIDLAHLGRDEITVPLSSAAGAAIQPEQVLFDAEESKIYVRGARSDDVFVLSLGANDDRGPNASDFRPTINQLAAGRQPADMALYGSGEDRRLLVVARSSAEAIVIEADTSLVTPVPLQASHERVMIFEGRSPVDANVEQRALLFGGTESRVTFVDLDQIEQRRGRNVEPVVLDRLISRIVPLPGGDVAMLVHGAGFSLLDLQDRTVSLITASDNLQDAIVDADSERLWVGPPGQPWLGWVTIGDGSTHEMLLDSDISRLVPMLDIQRMVVLHDDPLGHLTIVNTEEPRRETSVALQGLFIQEAFDLGE